RQGWTEGHIPSQPAPQHHAPHMRPQFGPQYAAPAATSPAPAPNPPHAPVAPSSAGPASATATLMPAPALPSPPPAGPPMMGPPPVMGGFPSAPQQPPHKRRRIGLGIAAVVAAMALSGGSAVAGGYAALQLRPQSILSVATAAT